MKPNEQDKQPETFASLGAAPASGKIVPTHTHIASPLALGLELALAVQLLGLGVTANGAYEC